MDIREKYEAAVGRIAGAHIRSFPGQAGPVLLISAAYPGVWLEHVYDAIAYATLFPEAKEVARNQTLLFLRNQKPNGRLPYNVLSTGAAGYSQIQECVSFGQLCLEAYRLLCDREYLKEAYKGLKAWDGWLTRHRMTTGRGLIELFCLYDTGHDNSARLADIPNKCPDVDGVLPADADAVPILAPDMNAVFYGDRMALAEMAEELGHTGEARAWREQADAVLGAMRESLYDPGDQFFYDVDRRGKKRKFLSIAISNVFQERALEPKLANAIYTRHMKNPSEFWTEYPFPSMAISDTGSVRDRDGNSWGYYAQALTALRCARWMDFYGHSADYDHLLAQWVEAICRSEMNFCQELDPRTGEMSKASEWYSSAMLLYIYAARRLGYVK